VTSSISFYLAHHHKVLGRHVDKIHAEPGSLEKIAKEGSRLGVERVIAARLAEKDRVKI
jgi:hypothetical protein